MWGVRRAHPDRGAPRRRGQGGAVLPGALPPVIRAQSLLWKLMAAGVVSLAKAAVRLAASGPDQPMMWYDFFRNAAKGSATLA